MHSQRGVTLLELAIVCGLIALMSGVMAMNFGPLMKFKNRIETEEKLSAMRGLFLKAYSDNAFTFSSDSSVGASLRLKTGEVVSSNCPALTGGDQFDSTVVAKALEPLAGYADRSLNQMVTDGFKRSLCVFVSPLQKKNYGGTPIYYRSVAVISLGETGAYKSTVDNAGDEFRVTLDPDNPGIVVDGYQIAVEMQKRTAEQLSHLARSYETYYNARYLDNRERRVDLNYFTEPYPYSISNNNDMAQSPMPLSEPSGLDIDGIVATKLGVTPVDGVSGWGCKIKLINAKDDRIRWESGNLPPFTALFTVPIPGPDSKFNNGECFGSTTMNQSAIGIL